MNWGSYAIQSVLILLVFLLTGAPVTPHLKNFWFNGYSERTTSYFTWLAFHYFLGAAFVAFLITGALRGVFWPRGGTKQAAFVWGIVMLISSIFTIYGSYRIMPVPSSSDANGSNVSYSEYSGLRKDNVDKL